MKEINLRYVYIYTMQTRGIQVLIVVIIWLILAFHGELHMQ